MFGGTHRQGVSFLLSNHCVLIDNCDYSTAEIRLYEGDIKTPPAVKATDGATQRLAILYPRFIQFFRAWTISDAFLETVKDRIPERQRAEGKTYKRNPGNRKNIAQTTSIRGNILYFTNGLSMESRAQRIRISQQQPSIFSRLGRGWIFEGIWSKGLEKYDELERTGWE